MVLLLVNSTPLLYGYLSDTRADTLHLGLRSTVILLHAYDKLTVPMSKQLIQFDLPSAPPAGKYVLKFFRPAEQPYTIKSTPHNNPADTTITLDTSSQTILFQHYCSLGKQINRQRTHFLRANPDCVLKTITLMAAFKAYSDSGEVKIIDQRGLLMPYFPGKTLSKYLHENFSPYSSRAFSLALFFRLAHAILDKVILMASNGSCHGDLSCENIMISEMGDDFDIRLVDTEFSSDLGRLIPTTSESCKYWSPDRTRVPDKKPIPAQEHHDAFSMAYIYTKMLRYCQDPDNAERIIALGNTLRETRADWEYQSLTLPKLRNILTFQSDAPISSFNFNNIMS